MTTPREQGRNASSKNKHFIPLSEITLDQNGEYFSGDNIYKNLDISEKTFFLLGDSGEFELGRLAGRSIVTTSSFLDYLDRSHFTASKKKDDPPVFDAKGKLRPGITYYKKKHTSIPVLKPIKVFAERLNMDERTFQRHCEIGTFSHYRIGAGWKMSEKDWEEGLYTITGNKMKSNRGGSRVKTVSDEGEVVKPTRGRGRPRNQESIDKANSYIHELEDQGSKQHSSKSSEDN